MKKLMILLIAATLVACSKSDDKKDDSGKKEGDVRSPVASNKIVQKPDLTAAQLQEIKEIMGDDRVSIKEELLLVSEDESDESKSERQKKLSQLTPNEKEVLETIQKNCEIDQPLETKSGFQMQTGDVENANKKAQISGGDKCPIRYKEESNKETLITETNMSELLKEFKQTGDEKVFEKLIQKSKIKQISSSSNVITDEDLQKRANLKEKSSDSESAADVVFKKNGEFFFDSKTTATTKIVSANDVVITVASKFDQILTPAFKDQYIEMVVKFPSSEPMIQYYEYKNGDKRYFLNGKAKNLADLKEIFGSDFSLGE